jgi:hypothetical protein
MFEPEDVGGYSGVEEYVETCEIHPILTRQWLARSPIARPKKQHKHVKKGTETPALSTSKMWGIRGYGDGEGCQ